MGLIALAADGGAASSTLQAEAVAMVDAQAALARAQSQALHAEVVGQLSASSGMVGCAVDANKHEQEMRVLELLQMDNRQSILRAMRDSMTNASGSAPGLRDFWGLQQPRGGPNVSSTAPHPCAPSNVGAKRRADSSLPMTERKRCRWKGQPRVLGKECIGTAVQNAAQSLPQCARPVSTPLRCRWKKQQVLTGMAVEVMVGNVSPRSVYDGPACSA